MRLFSLVLVCFLISSCLFAQHPTDVTDPWPYDAVRYYNLNHNSTDSVLTKTATFRVDNTGKLLQKSWIKGPAFGGDSIEVEYFGYTTTGVQDRYRRYRFFAQKRTLEYEWEKTFDASGNLIQEASYYLHGSASRRATRELALYQDGQIVEFGFLENDNGTLDTISKVLSVVSEGNIVQVDRFRYDTLNQEFLPTMREMFDYDDAGRTRSTSSLIPASQSPTPEWIHMDSTWRQYDELGRLVYFIRLEWDNQSASLLPDLSSIVKYSPDPVKREQINYLHLSQDSFPQHRSLERDSAGILISEFQSWKKDCDCWHILNGFKSLIWLDANERESLVETDYFFSGEFQEKSLQINLYHASHGLVKRYSRQLTPLTWLSDSASGSSIVFDTNEFAGEPFMTSESGLFSVFPNPGEGNIVIGMQEPGTATIQVLDLAGRLIHQQEIRGQFPGVDLPAMTGGVYLIRLIRDGEVHTQKFTHR